MLRRRRVRLAGGVRLAFALCENQVTVLVDTGDGWQPLLTERDKVAALVDLRREATLAGYATPAGRTGVTASTVRAGLFGMTGLRDPHLVQHADGTPYVRDGRAYLTWTCAGLGFFQQAHWRRGPSTSPHPSDMRLVAQLFSRRDGLVLGDHAGQLVRRRVTAGWWPPAPGATSRRAASTSGTPRPTADLLTGVHVLDTEPTPLPTEPGHLGPRPAPGSTAAGTSRFVESPSQDPFDFHPALAVGPGSGRRQPWSEDLELVAAADDLHQCEGPILAAGRGTTWLLASDRSDRTTPSSTSTGSAAAASTRRTRRTSRIPSWCRIPGAGGWMVTFDGTQYAEDVMGYGGHGDVVADALGLTGSHSTGRPSPRAMSMRWTSEVPSPISRTFASR